MRFPKTHLLLAVAGHILGVALICLVSGCGDAGTTADSPTAPAISSYEGRETAAPAAVDLTGPAARRPDWDATTKTGGSALAAAPAGGTKLAGREIWMANFAEAKSQAEMEGKDILMDFTGSDWCGWCIRLNDEVFRHQEFVDYAAENFVLLELDFPRDRSNLSEKTQAQNAELQNRFSIQGFPTILLTDAQGRPYARTGYQPGGPETYLKHLDDLRGAHTARDEAIAAAGELTGIERAKKLDEALSAISADLLFPSYEAEVAQIVSLDENNEAGLRDQYQERLTAVRFQRKAREIEQFMRTAQDVDATLKKIDELESEFADFSQGPLNANLMRVQVLQSARRMDEVIKLADTVLADDKIQGKGRLTFYVTKLGALEQLKRLDEAVEVVDVIRKETADEPGLSARLLLTRANFLAQLDRIDEAREALNEARQQADAQFLPAIDRLEKELFPADANAGSNSGTPATGDDKKTGGPG